jgi:hypothetical protein
MISTISNNSSIFSQISLRIIREQELVIGPLAWDEAKKVSGLSVDRESNSAFFSEDRKEVINRLVGQYEKLFGRASHEVCRDAVQDITSQMSPEEVPSSLA